MEKTVALILALVTAALLVGPVVLALSSNNWNIREVVVPPEENMNNIKEEALDLQNPGEFRVVGRELNGETGDLEVYAQFKSSVDFDIILKDFYTQLRLDGQNVGEMRLMKEEVALRPGEATNFTLEGQIKDESLQLFGLPSQDPSTVSGGMDGEVLETSSTGLQNLDFANSTAELEMMGINLELRNLVRGGFV